jgi:hypothetical protein
MVISGAIWLVKWPPSKVFKMRGMYSKIVKNNLWSATLIDGKLFYTA